MAQCNLQHFIDMTFLSHDQYVRHCNVSSSRHPSQIKTPTCIWFSSSMLDTMESHSLFMVMLFQAKLSGNTGAVASFVAPSARMNLSTIQDYELAATTLNMAYRSPGKFCCLFPLAKYSSCLKYLCLGASRNISVICPQNLMASTIMWNKNWSPSFPQFIHPLSHLFLTPSTLWTTLE